jgi:hypothetical protein
MQNMPSQKPKILLIVDESLFSRLDDYRADLYRSEGGRILNRSQAIRRLIEEGLSKQEKKGKK